VNFILKRIKKFLILPFQVLRINIYFSQKNIFVKKTKTPTALCHMIYDGDRLIRRGPRFFRRRSVCYKVIYI
jgi:hypothetical protein